MRDGRPCVLVLVVVALSACASATPPAGEAEPAAPAPETTPAAVSPAAEAGAAEVERPPGAALREIAVRDVVSLSLGDEHACAADRAGRVWCWGHGGAYRLGQGRIESSKRPLQVMGIDRAASVAAGGTETCAIRQDATVMCWGGYRQIPGDEDGIEWPLVRLPETVAYPVAWTRQVSVGSVQATLLDAAGGVAILDAYVGPVPLTEFRPARAVASLSDGFCALGRDGEVQCVNSQEMGASGNGGGEGGYGEEPSTVVAPLTWSEALRPALFDDEGEARWAPCWREEDSTEALPAFCGETMRGVTAIDAHEGLACAVLGDGGLACWGCGHCYEDDAPPLGLPEGLKAAAVPFRIPQVVGVVQVAVGGRHICTLHKDGGVSCWGDDLEGQLGPLGRGTSATPVRVPDLGEVAAIDASDDTTCALRKNGTVACWGHVLGTAAPDRYADLETDDAAADDAEEEDVAPAPATREPPEGLGNAAPTPELNCRDVDVFDRDGGALAEVQYGYDRAGHLREERRGAWSDGALAVERTTRFVRDRKGRATRVDFSEPRDNGATYRGSVSYRYDRAGNVVWRKGHNVEDDGVFRYKWDGAGRLIEVTSSWDTKKALAWRQREGEAGGPFAGLTLHEADTELQYWEPEEPLTVSYAVDAEGRVVYRRTVEPREGVFDAWTRFDAAGRAVVVREAKFEVPFFEDALERWETRLSYDAAGRLTTTERYELETAGGGEESAVLVRRTVHLAAGCL